MTIAIVSNSAWNIFNFRLSLIKRLQLEGYHVVAITPQDKYAFDLAKIKGLDFVPINHLNRKSTSLIGNTRLLIELSKTYAQLRPDLIIHFTTKPNIIGSFAARLQNIKSISSLEGQGYLGNGGFYRRAISFFYKKAFAVSQSVIFLNEADKNEFIERRLVRPEKAVLIHGPGVDSDHFHATAKKVSSPVVFLFCGRLLEEKGIRAFVEAAKTCRDRKIKARFHVLGSQDEGNPSSIKAKEIQKWIRDGWIVFHGHQDDVRPFLAKSDVVVLPSVYHEGVPRSLLEAMAMNKVTITSDKPGCRDTVEEGKNGFIIPPNDHEKLVEAIEKCCRLSAQKFLEMGDFARTLVLTEFDDRIVLKKYMDLIEATIGSPKNLQKTCP